MKQILLTAFLLISLKNFSQITKGNWLVGGSASFSSANYNGSGGGAGSYTQTNISILPSIGYFITDNFSLGLKTGYSFGKAGNISVNTFNIGPFLRYYFLKSSGNFNIFSEADYLYSSTKLTGNPASNGNTFSFAAGPVIYFNTSIGLEFTIGYSTFKYIGDVGRINTLQAGIGFQIHLDK